MFASAGARPFQTRVVGVALLGATVLGTLSAVDASAAETPGVADSVLAAVSADPETAGQSVPVPEAQPRLSKSPRGQILRDGVAWRTGGVNIFDLALTDYPTVGLRTRAEIDDRLDHAVAMGAYVVRAHTLGVSVGEDTPGALVRGVTGTTEPVIGYDAEAWAITDYAIAAAAERGIYLMIPMTDELGHYHGGKRHWVDFRRPGSVSLDSAVTSANSSAQRAAESLFYTDPQIVTDFQQYLTDWLNHVNPITGRANKDEPAVAIIETGNELWTAPQDAPTWTPMIAAHIKSVAPNVLVADGSASDGVDVSTAAWASPDVDIVGTHPYSTFTASTVTSQAVFAESKGKAYIVGEYAWSKASASEVEAAVRARPNAFTSAPWSLHADDDLHNYGAAYGTDDVSLYVSGEDAPQKAAVARLRAHAAALGGVRARSAEASSPPVSTNLIESDALRDASDASLIVGGAATYTDDTTTFLTGGSSLRVAPGGAGVYPYWYFATPAGDAAPIAAGDRYTGFASVRASTGGQGVHAVLLWYTSGGTILSSAPGLYTALPGGTWETVSVTGVAPAGAAYAAVQLQSDVAMDAADVLNVDQYGVRAANDTTSVP